nr:M48 family metalloprotease [Bacteroidia bacterium]
MKDLQVFIYITFLLLTSCQSKDGDYTFFSPEDDLAFGKQMAAQIDNNRDGFPLIEKSTNPELYRHLENISNAILQSDHILHRDEFSWELKVIDNDTIYNAFCIPGGFIYVYSGLIRFVESEDELAGIIGHEIAHADLRHSTDQMTKTYGGKVLVSIILGGDAEILTNLGVNLLGLKFSRNDEEEADEYAVKYLSDTNYDPRAFAAFFERIEKTGASMGPLQFLSTHPNPENRFAKIETFWSENGSNVG